MKKSFLSLLSERREMRASKMPSWVRVWYRTQVLSHQGVCATDAPLHIQFNLIVSGKNKHYLQCEITTLQITQRF
jgi:hypothetical protein